MSKYYDRQVKQQPDIAVGDLVMLNAKNIWTKRPTKKLSPRLYGPFKVIERRGNRAFKLEISPRWKIHPIFHVSLLEPYYHSNRPGWEQPRPEPEKIHCDLEWEVERIIKSEIITYVRRRGWMQEIRYFVKWAGCSEDKNIWEPPASLENAQELVESFHRENPEMPKFGRGWMTKKGFPWCGQVNPKSFFTLLKSSSRKRNKIKKEDGARGRDRFGGSSS